MRPPGAGLGHAAASPPCPSTRRYRRPSRSSGGRNASADHARADDPRRGAPRGPRPSVTVKVAHEAARLRPRPRGSLPRRVPRHAVASRPLRNAGRRSSLYRPRHRPSPLRRQRTGTEQGHAPRPDSGAPECRRPDTRQIQCSTHAPGPVPSPFRNSMTTNYQQPQTTRCLLNARVGSPLDDPTSDTTRTQTMYMTRDRAVAITFVTPCSSLCTLPQPMNNPLGHRAPRDHTPHRGRRGRAV